MKIKNILLVSVLALSSNQLFSKENEELPPLFMPITGVVDGDTIRTVYPLLPKSLAKIKIRVYGIDTPEKGWRSKCVKEHNLAIDATNFLKKFIGSTRWMKLTNYKYGKYGGRLVAKVEIKGKDISEMMIENGYAVPYYGKKKSSWCEKGK
jgi:endonuclease YncB( thermonuclease family)